MNQFPKFLQFDLGLYVEMFVQWLKNNFSTVFDAFSASVIWFLVRVDILFQFIPWWLFLTIVFLVGWRIRNFSLGISFVIMLFLIGSFGLWNHMIITLSIILTSVLISLFLGIPLGVLMSYSKIANTVMKPILDGMQTMPSFVYLIPAILLFPLGKVPAVFATIIYSLPPVIRLTNLGIRRVSKEMVEAAHSFGSSSWQLLTKVQLPQALPTIMAGINQTTMMALAMVVIASMVGAKGLGMDVLIAINRMELGNGFEAGISIVFLAIIIDRISQGIADRFKFPE
jgi:glycine betaine/proline transport system permease protein